MEVTKEKSEQKTAEAAGSPAASSLASSNVAAQSVPGSQIPTRRVGVEASTAGGGAAEAERTKVSYVLKCP